MPRIRHYTAVRIVSLLHLLWGVSILVFYPFGVEMPRPFGSQEAFLEYMPPWAMASLLLSGAIICRAALFWKVEYPLAAVLCVVPQQILLLWSTMWNVGQLGIGYYEDGAFDARNWLSLCYLCALSWYHATDLVALWRRAIGSISQDAD